jgi:hypothetical protein
MMMMLFVLNGDNDDRDENGKEERRCSRHHPPPLGGASAPPTTAHTNQRYDKSPATDDNKHGFWGEYLFYFFVKYLQFYLFSQVCKVGINIHFRG